MRARNTRKALRDLKSLCRGHGLELTVVPGKGKGSHQGLLFRDPKTDESVSLTIAGSEDISPGVQRSVLQYVRDLAARVAIAEILREIFEDLFSG
ncbi:MAG: hypothetical protein WB524_05745 [Acidobacteriaceae bacterium]